MRGNRIGLQVLFGPPSFLTEGERGREREEEKERGARPLPWSSSDSPWDGAMATPCGLPSLSPMAHVGPLLPRGDSRNSPVLQKIPESLGTFLMSEYSLPIY